MHIAPAKLVDFNATLPVVTAMQAIGIRPRHWEALSARVGAPCDPANVELTLARILELKFSQQSLFVLGELTTKAHEQHELYLLLTVRHHTAQACLL